MRIGRTDLAKFHESKKLPSWCRNDLLCVPLGQIRSRLDVRPSRMLCHPELEVLNVAVCLEKGKFDSEDLGSQGPSTR